jgi:hypothetical protein
MGNFAAPVNAGTNSLWEEHQRAERNDGMGLWRVTRKAVAGGVWSIHRRPVADWIANAVVPRSLRSSSPTAPVVVILVVALVFVLVVLFFLMMLGGI